MKTGLIHIYTGDGKGKTTSSIGLAVRALSHGKQVCYTYFNKNPFKYGLTEIEGLKKLGATIIGLTDEHPSFNSSITNEEHQLKTQTGLETLSKYIQTNPVDMLIMDEILISVRDGFLTEESLIHFIQNKPTAMELVMTGRGATNRLIEMADYVSRIEKIKHPMDNGTASREGVEF